jgi:competence protein ComGC
MGFIKEYFTFLKEEKKWWLIPLIIILLIIGVVFVIMETPVGALIYPLL